MQQYTNIDTRVFRGCGFMTIAKYNNSGEQIYIADKDSKIITAIETVNYSIVGTYIGHNGIIWNLDLSYDDSILISSSGDLTICFFDTSNGNMLYQINEKSIPKYVCTQKKNLQTNLVSIICEALSKKSKTSISIYDLNLINSNQFCEKIRLEWNRTSKPNILLWLNEQILIIGCDDGKIVLRDINDIDGTNEVEYKFHNDSIKSIVWNKSYSKILTSSIDCTAKQIEISNWSVVATYISIVPINWACWNHNDRKVFIGGGIEAMNVAKTLNNDLNLKIYRTSDQKLTNQIGSHFGPIRYIDKSPSSKNFITSSQDGTVKIYFINDEINDKTKVSNIELNNNIKTFEKFNINHNQDIFLKNETNKMLNLNWKPSRQDLVSTTNAKKLTQEISNNTTNTTNTTNINLGIFDIKSLNNDEYLNKKFEHAQKDNDVQNTTIRVTNLPCNIHYQELMELFDLYGRIEERGGIKIKQYEDTTMAFIKYIYPESVEKAINCMDGYPLEYQIIKVELAKSK